MDHDKIWDDFSKKVLDHIHNKAKKYNRYNTSDSMSIEYWIDSMRKYMDEVKVAHEDKISNFNFDENLKSIAHIAAIVQMMVYQPPKYNEMGNKAHTLPNFGLSTVLTTEGTKR
jgi:hypothetical protein